jgi:hypothetical protein
VRTTVTLDPDVERLLRRAIRERGVSFKEALNGALRKGLAGDKPSQPGRFVQKTFPLGGGMAFPWDKALALADAIEDEEIGRKIAMRK